MSVRPLGRATNLLVTLPLPEGAIGYVASRIGLAKADPTGVVLDVLCPPAGTDVVFNVQAPAIAAIATGAFLACGELLGLTALADQGGSNHGVSIALILPGWDSEFSPGSSGGSGGSS